MVREQYYWKLKCAIKAASEVFCVKTEVEGKKPCKYKEERNGLAFPILLNMGKYCGRTLGNLLLFQIGRSLLIQVVTQNSEREGREGFHKDTECRATVLFCLAHS